MNRPLGITIAAIVLTIGGVLQLLFAADTHGWTSFGLAPAGDAATAWAALVDGVLSLLVAAGLFTLRPGMWTIVVLVLGIRVVIDAVTVFLAGATSNLGYSAIGNGLVSAFFLWYLFRQPVRTAFGR